MDKHQAEQLLRPLTQLLAAKSPFALAFSGGLDSRFLAHVALTARLPFTAFHVTGPHIPQKETEKALLWLSCRKIENKIIVFDPLKITTVQAGSVERCYACKKEMFLRLRTLTENMPMLDGSNASDLKQFRPGLKALKELGVLSPLAECGISKPNVRTLAAFSGLDDPSQPSRPCLLTRFDYGVTPTSCLLSQIEKAECAVAELGFTDFRLRISKTSAALLHVGWDEAGLLEQKHADLTSVLVEHGFENITAEAQISLSGYFDEQKEENETK